MTSLVDPADLRLRQRCVPTRSVSEPPRLVFRRLLEVLQVHPGLGLAAPQIGELVRCCVVLHGKNGTAECMADPVINWASPEMQWVEEGCLSCPGTFLPVRRHASVAVDFTDYDGKRRNRRFEGMHAACAQHEIDHLDGVLFTMRAADQGDA